MVDSHAHIALCDQPEAEVVEAAAAVGVNRILNVGLGDDSNPAAVALAGAHEAVFACVGHHPNGADGFDEAAAQGIEALARREEVVAVGETGLDFYRDRAPHADQARAFAAQIELARAVAKPLVIHTRAAEDETVDTLATRAQGVEVVMHCFSMPDRLDECLERGWWISFAGNVTYPKSTELADAAERVPLERLLVETDAPYLTPQAMRKHRNQSAYVVHTARFIADRRGIAYEELEQAVEANAARLFGW